tara:strand:+ start:855 stop:1070 length:216 start_codon:yes stop_codon:yes gene_type:complete
MVKLILSNEKMVTLVKGNKKIQRSEVDYETNKKVWDFKGFKQVEDSVKEEKVVELKPKKRKTRKKKDEQIN